MNNVHINSINIETYRGLKNLKLEGFTSVNILTGDNNCGKTSIMELLNTLISPTQAEVWQSLIRRPFGTPRNISYYEGFIDLFDKSSNEEPKIKYCITDFESKEHNIALSYEIKKESVSVYTANKLSKKQFSTDEKRMIANRLYLTFNYNSQFSNTYKIFEFEDTQDFLLDGEKHSLFHRPVIYVSPTAHGKNSVYLKDVLNNSELYPEMLSVLQNFDSDIISINQYSAQNSTNEYCGILTKKFKNALPLNMYGDGMKKAILLMSAVVVAKGGVLLIDEFETAIHTSAMTKIYSWILKTCKNLDVQLFMTTHSKEALQKVLALNSEPELKDDITLYTLYKKDGKNIARRLSAERAIEADEHFNQELR